MKKHVEIYMIYFDYTKDDVMLCEYCQQNGIQKRLVDCHHLVFRSHSGKDEITNLIGLCRAHHVEAHDNKAFNQHLKSIVTKRHEQN